VHGALALLDPRWDPSVGAGDCKDAWGDHGEELSPCDKTPDDYVVVNKTKRNIALCNAGSLSKNFRVGLGFTPAGDKTIQGDGKTPEGVLYIPTLLPDSDYHRAFLLSYPRKQDAARAFNEGLISKEEHDQIISAQDTCTEPLQATNLGGAVEIHGEGSSKDWTAGCVGLENADIDVLWGVLEAGDTIVVLP
jgi:murein L,D-transpeptidase YafK